MLARAVDAAVFSSAWLAAAAAGLVAASARAMEIPLDPRLLGLAAAGTLVVYNVDRLRDLERDRLTAPARSAFVERWCDALVLGTGAAALIARIEGPGIERQVIPPAAWSHAVPCPADLDGSGAVDFGDVLAVLSAWGSAGGPEDLDGNGTVEFGDLLVVLSSWGPCV